MFKFQLLIFVLLTINYSNIEIIHQDNIKKKKNDCIKRAQNLNLKS